MWQFMVLLYLEGTGLALRGSAEALGSKGMNRTNATDVLRCILNARQQAKRGNSGLISIGGSANRRRRR
jgi:hypothetical protein